MERPTGGTAVPYCIAALGLVIGAALWTTGPAVSQETWAPAFLRGYAVAWVFYVLASIMTARSRNLPRWVLVWIVIVAIGLRLVAFARTPPLSTDAFRYLWDGRVANAGINPFSYPPSAGELRGLRDENWQQISFMHIPTIYPPAAQLLSRALTRIEGRDITSFRVTFSLCDIGCVLLLIALLRHTGCPPERAIWYAWCPLPITEATGGAHLDPFALLLFLAALLVVFRRTPRSAVASGIALACSVMAKGYAVLALPQMVRRGGWRLAAAFAVTNVLLIAPYVCAGGKLLDGLKAYTVRWETNASLFIIINKILTPVTEDHFLLTRKLTVAVVLLIVGVLTWRLRRGPESLLRAVFFAFGAQLMFGAPTLPWYTIWVIPALCWWTIPGLVLFTLTVSLQYYARWLYPGDRAAHFALLWAGYLPVYALLIGQVIWWVVRLRRASSRRAAPEQQMNRMI